MAAQSEIASPHDPAGAPAEGWAGLDPSASLLREAARQAGIATDIVEMHPREGPSGNGLTITLPGGAFVYDAGGLHHVSALDSDRPGADINGHAADIVMSRDAVRARLALAGIPVPAGRALHESAAAVAVDFALSLGGGIEVAPDDRRAAQAPEVCSAAKARQAVQRLFRSHSTVSIAECVSGETVRFLYVEPAIVAVQWLRPACVVGDGHASVLELIASRNADRDLAGRPGHRPVTADGGVAEVLQAQGHDLASVPYVGERVALGRDLSAGMEIVALGDAAIHPSHGKVAQAALRAIPGLRFAALDMRIADMRAPASPDNGRVVGIDGNPPLDGFHAPWEGAPQDAAGAVVALLQRIAQESEAGEAEEADGFDPAIVRDLDPDTICFIDALKQADVPAKLVQRRCDGARRCTLQFKIGGQTYHYRAGSLRIAVGPGRARHINGRATLVTLNKSACKAKLAAAGVSTPAGRRFARHQLDEALRFAAQLGRPVCVKPNAAFGGKLAFPNRDGPLMVAAAFRKVAEKHREIVVEEHVSGQETRFFYVRPREVAIKRSTLPVVHGDGESSVLRLIDGWNAVATKIRFTHGVVTNAALTALLSEQGHTLDDVPEAGRALRLGVVGQATAGAGQYECRDDVHPSYWKAAEDACQAVDVVVAAVDMIVADPKRPAAPGNYWVLEVNSSPSIHPYVYPWGGKVQDPAGALISYLRQHPVSHDEAPDDDEALAAIDDEDEDEADEETDDERDPRLAEMRMRVQLTIQDALQRMEGASPETIAATQFNALERIVRHAGETTAFYRKRLAPLLGDGGFAPEAWQAVPLLTREEARESIEALRSSRLPEDVGTYTVQTSGSSGSPLSLSWNKLATISTRAVVERMYAWHGLDPSEPLAEIRSFPGRATMFPGRRVPRGWSFRDPDAPFYRLSVETPVERQLGWLQLVEPRYLITYPTMARELAMLALKTGARLRLDAVLTVGEVMTREIRDLCAEAFGARTIDSYGCQEMGKIAVQCEAEEHYHVCVSNVILEVLDEAGRHVGPGETGRVVLTSLYNYATPLIRYEIGDYARLGAHRCACGRMLPVLSEVHGRRRNMITLPDGRRLWLPGRTLSAMAAFVPSRRMRLVQLAPDRFQLLYEVDGSGAAPDMTGLSACAARLIHPDVTIDPQAVEELSRSAGGKYEDIVGLDA